MTGRKLPLWTGSPRYGKRSNEPVEKTETPVKIWAVGGVPYGYQEFAQYRCIELPLSRSRWEGSEQGAYRVSFRGMGGRVWVCVVRAGEIRQ